MEKKHKNLIVGLLIVALLLLVGYMLLRDTTPDSNMTEEETTEEEMTEEETTEEEATVSAREVVLNEQNNSGQNGNARLESLGSTTRVTIDVTALAGSQPAHIHSGTCEDLGGVVYPLSDVEDGHSETVVDVSLDGLLEGTFAINLHVSPEEIGVYTACGDIK